MLKIRRDRLLKKISIVMFIVLLAVSIDSSTMVQAEGVMKTNQGGWLPTVTYNVSGMDLGPIANDEVGRHFYENGTFEPGEVVFWGTVTNNMGPHPTDPKQHYVDYKAKIIYKDSQGKEHLVKETGRISIAPGGVSDYRISGIVPEDAGHIYIDIIATCEREFFPFSLMKADFYKISQGSASSQGKIIGENFKDQAPTVTYNVKGINLGPIHREVDGEAFNVHEYKKGKFQPGPIELYGTVKNNAKADKDWGQDTVTLIAMFKYNDSSGKEQKIATDSIKVGPGSSADYKITANIPKEATYVYMDVSCFKSWSYGAGLGALLAANLSPGLVETVIPIPTQPSLPPTKVESPTSGAETFEYGARIMWNPVKGLGYRLYRATSPSELGISVTDFYITSTSYADVNGEPNTTYYYTVKPVLAEANPFQDIEEKLGDPIATFTVKTGPNILKPGSFKHFIMLKLDSPKMSVDGIDQEVDPGRGTSPLVISGRTMVPIRAVVEAMGGTAEWEGSTRKITLKARGNTVEMWLDKKEIKVNGETKQMDIAPISKNDRTFVPVRFAAENIDCKVDWINSTKEAVIVYEE